MSHTYNSWADMGIKIVQEKYPAAQLLEIHGVAYKMTGNPGDLKEMKIVFCHNETETIIIRSKNLQEFREPQMYAKPYLGSIVIPWPIAMDLQEAQQLKEDAGFTDPYSRVSLRHLMHPNIHPCFIFNSAASGFIYVDIVSKKVSQGEPPQE